MPLQHLFISYSNGEPKECEFRDLGGSSAGSVKHIPFLSVCGNITMEAVTLSTPIVSCSYEGPQTSVVIKEETQNHIISGCSIQAIIV